MSSINFTCPHCSYTTQLASSTEGMKGNCPSCKAEVVITPDTTESDWLVMSSGLKSETPTKLKDSEIIALIRDETIAGGAQLSNLSESTEPWIDLKDSHFYQYVEEVKANKQQIREEAKIDKLVQEAIRKQEIAEEKQLAQTTSNQTTSNQTTSEQTKPTASNAKLITSCLAIFVITIAGFVFVCGNILNVEPSTPQDPRQARIENNFSLWDGSYTPLVKIIKDGMHDPSSFDHVETTYRDLGDHLIVTTKFRGKNGFGAVVTNSMTAKFNLDGGREY
jgi:hypothetical protein